MSFSLARLKQQAVFDKKLAEEEVWIRKGIQARRTRNEGRVRALKKCAKNVPNAVMFKAKTKLDLSDAQKSGRKVITVNEISYEWGEQALIYNFIYYHLARRQNRHNWPQRLW